MLNKTFQINLLFKGLMLPGCLWRVPHTETQQPAAAV
uniref:Uncharacterized protein n=1 Tax=Anguilla anguilla TaxID=7936 RepID=A0A0E9W8A3_ANGAN